MTITPRVLLKSIKSLNLEKDELGSYSIRAILNKAIIRHTGDYMQAYVIIHSTHSSLFKVHHKKRAEACPSITISLRS